MKYSLGVHLTAIVLLSASTSIMADDWPQWRGPQRNGTSSETGLLKDWPASGPALRWKATNIGSGYAAPSVVGDQIYVLGNTGLENEFVQALGVKDGKRIWSSKLGNVGQNIDLVADDRRGR